MFPQPPPPGLVPSCAEAGVLGVLPGVIGTIQATETVKLLLGAPDTLVGRLLLYDAWTMRFRELVLRKDPACAWCGEHPSMHALVDYDELCGTRPPAAGGAAGSAGAEMSPSELRDLRARGEDHVLLDVREAVELALSRLGGETHIPLGELAQRFGELDPERRTVVMCHHGMRSAQAVHWLRGRGFEKLHNLAGGIDAYSHEVDPAVPRY